MDERRVADYFVVAGIPENPEPLSDFSDGAHLKPTHNQAPITDIGVMFPGLGEIVPEGFTMIESTPTGFLADLNHGSLRSPEVYLCIRRGWDKPPLVDIGVMYEGKERIMADSEIVLMTPGGRYANVNNSAAKTYVTFRRAPITMPCNELVVTDVCVILTSKGEVAPHAFCMINKNLNKGIVGANVFLCYKKSMNRANLISYKPGVLSRYPHSDHGYFPFPTHVPMFCLPMGASMECWPKSAKQPRPVFSTFVLTVANASEKVYGSAVTFYEQVPTSSLTDAQLTELKLAPGDNAKFTINVNKTVCLLSHWPFFDTFEKFLLFIHELGCKTPPQCVPIERHISNFLECVPFPSAQRPHILVQLSATDRVVLTQPEDLPLPRSGASFRELLMNLGPENCLMVLLLVLMEQKLLLHSLRPNVLTAVAEAITMMLFPLKWQYPYVPLCPMGLAEVLDAPLSFIFGVDSRFFDLYDPPADVTCVDLDTNHITICEEKRSLNVKLLPKKPARNLRNTLDKLYHKAGVLAHSTHYVKDDSIDREFQIKRKEQALELEIQEAFLRFMASLLKGYQAFLLPITKARTVGATDFESLFAKSAFMRACDKAHHKFFALLMRSQMFIRFIEQRSFVSDMDAGLAFFDECTEKVDGDECDARLLELDESHRSERTVFILPPEPTGLPANHVYPYPSFTLDPSLFGRTEPRHPSHLPVAGGNNVPGSPMARRTKHEIRSAQKLARKNADTPDNWAKCLLGTCYSLWFIHLPSYAMQGEVQKAPAVLRAAYDMLVRIQKLKLQPTDEVCYRVMMQLCGVYSQPVLAVKLLFHMKRSNVQPNAITYGFYNRAVLDSQWPSDCTNSSQLMWNKLRNVIVGVALFRRAGSRKREEELNSISADVVDRVSRTSLESATSQESMLDTTAGRAPHSVGLASASVAESDASAQVSANDGSTLDTGLASASAGGIELALDTCVAAAQSNALDSGSETDSSEGKTASRIVTAASGSMDFKTFDKFRSRVGSIVRPSGLPLLSPNTLQQQSFESSAGLLMTGSVFRRSSTVAEDEDVFDSDILSASDSPLLKRRQRYRTGSLTADGFQGFAGLRHAAINKCPTSPKDAVAQETNCPDLGMLIRSESFANDAQILSNLKRLKLHLNSESSRLINNGHAIAPQDLDGKRFSKPSLSRSLFGRPGTTNALGSTASFESSTEHLSERSSTGSADDLDSMPRGPAYQPGRFLSRVWDRAKSSSPSRSNDSLDSRGKLDEEEDVEEVVVGEVELQEGRNHTNSVIGEVGVKEGRNHNERTVGEGDVKDERFHKERMIGEGDVKDERNHKERMVEEVDDKEESNHKERTIGKANKEEGRSKTPSKPDREDGRNFEESSGELCGKQVVEEARTPTSPLGKNSPVRTPVTENDPLGALDAEVEPPESNETSRESSLAPGVEEFGLVDAAGCPVLFAGSKGVSRSATFTHDAALTPNDRILESKHERGKPMHRSSTMPVNVTPPTSSAASSIGSIGSSFKLPFSRYSPGRFSLRKEDLKIGTQIIENAFSNFSPSSLTTKKSNEIFLGGLNSLKSAATTVAKKFDEIKEAMSTPVKTNTRHRGSDARPDGTEEEVSDSVTSSEAGVAATGGNQLGPLLADSWPVNLWEYFNDGSRKGSSSNLQPMGSVALSQSQIIFPENLYPREALTRPAGSVTALELAMTTCSKCHHCASVLYDEEIMAGWVPEDSNLNTKCQFCSKATVPFLTVIVLDFRSRPMDSVAEEDASLGKSSEQLDSKPKNDEEPPSFTSLEPITVPYLNPLVLRKEFENILHCEGDSCLTQPKFVDEHPIIYWNMVWVFQRINVSSHLAALSLNAVTVNRDRVVHPSWSAAGDHMAHVAVRCLWDNPRLHEEVGLPMYVLWQQNAKQSALVSALVTDRTTVSRGVMQLVIRSVRCSDLFEPLKKLAMERQKMKGRGVNRTHSIYRDILFLSMTVMGRENIDQTAFDREYVSAYERLPERDLRMFHRCDRPLSVAALCCRHYFRELQL